MPGTFLHTPDLCVAAVSGAWPSVILQVAPRQRKLSIPGQAYFVSLTSACTTFPQNEFRVQLHLPSTSTKTCQQVMDHCITAGVMPL